MNLTTLLALPFWLVLLLRFSLAPALRPRTYLPARPIGRQWRAVRPLAGRLLAVRVQVVLL